MNGSRKKLGRAGEKAVRKYLKRSGYKILARNYSVSGGEIDLICLHDDCIVFVEVKTRSDPPSSDDDPFVSAGQWRHAEKAAGAWLAAHRQPDCAYRFDAVSVHLPAGEEPLFRHVLEAHVPAR